jgi:hypothetical protein
VDQVRHQSPSGGFVKQDENTGRWYEVGDFLAREKTSQAFRDALHERYKSSNVSKKNRRREEQARASDVYSRIARDNRLEQLSQEIFQQHGVRYESPRVSQLTEDFIRQSKYNVVTTVKIVFFTKLSEIQISLDPSTYFRSMLWQELNLHEYAKEANSISSLREILHLYHHTTQATPDVNFKKSEDVKFEKSENVNRGNNFSSANPLNLDHCQI